MQFDYFHGLYQSYCLYFDDSMNWLADHYQKLSLILLSAFSCVLPLLFLEALLDRIVGLQPLTLKLNEGSRNLLRKP